MTFFSKAPLAERRKSIRSNITLDTQVFVEDEIILSKIINLSCDGACIALPRPSQAYGKFKIFAVDIPGIGHLSAIKRWAHGFEVGIQFTNPAQSGKAIERFFSEKPAGLSGVNQTSKTSISSKPESALL